MEKLGELAGKLRSGELSLETLIDALEERFNETEPEVLAFVPEADRFARLRAEARKLQERHREPGARPALYGVPIGVKDIFHVDGHPTRAGSQLPAEALAGGQAASVTALLEAGGLVLGKTVTTEFAYFAPGPTRNPRNLDHTPGGSSSGSAAALAAGLAPLALGTQTIGSVIRPAAFCGVVGFKPSYDRISRAGVIPLAPSVDHIGFFTADATSASLVASILCQNWQPAEAGPAPALGVPEGPFLEHASPSGRAHFDSVLKRLTAEGYQVLPVAALDDFEAIRQFHDVIVAAEAARVHAAWFEAYADLYHPRTAELIEHGQTIGEDALIDALRSRGGTRARLEALMRKHRIDLWIAPSAPGAAPRGLESTGDPVMNLPWTHSGLPAVNLPSGNNDQGLPLGIQLIGGWYQDERLLDWAAQLEPFLNPEGEREGP